MESEQGPYDCFRITKVGPCDGFESDIVHFPLSLNKDGENLVIEANGIRLPFDFDDKVSGNYSLKKFGSCLRSSRFPVMWYGKYRVKKILIRNQERVGCYCTEGTIDPK
ncbi:Protein of unknown function [Gryllus bimaculatus]|nr:Protein of unknown function [Gryllus bimaculatus]